eukprot:COSAG04_NODE_81_length_27945_cov_46.142821_4_plen_83_part_00
MTRRSQEVKSSPSCPEPNPLILVVYGHAQAPSKQKAESSGYATMAEMVDRIFPFVDTGRNSADEVRNHRSSLGYPLACLSCS